jgi:hypothetical protein
MFLADCAKQDSAQRYGMVQFWPSTIRLLYQHFALINITKEN